ncbi:hypothetical protein DSM106972_013980 [Dulcicalothrix desertica PCC 7102]|uniref:Uncharacterized protein n=1 Tax=Dulcicalothrix desertica PCC 7102 TaxID=232991 RepID=A0A433VQ52_9CYAN|nr:hypothetical protein [Dulcicalothrix desertica]RUT08230.1 hypothetical protein DSM106972_013980 [Dulcicalothrix desertica PCC 7102]TWH40101.1 hypothetical protein CAL7102_09397 [Dulcicalothrix desertica PCC 7102]
MTNLQLPDDNIDARLKALGNKIDQLRTEMRQVREETIYNTQITSIQDSVVELLDIARLHQKLLRVSEGNVEQDREVFRQVVSEMQGIGTENQRILEHLFRRKGE